MIFSRSPDPRHFFEESNSTQHSVKEYLEKKKKKIKTKKKNKKKKTTYEHSVTGIFAK